MTKKSTTLKPKTRVTILYLGRISPYLLAQLLQILRGISRRTLYLEVSHAGLCLHLNLKMVNRSPFLKSLPWHNGLGTIVFRGAKPFHRFLENLNGHLQPYRGTKSSTSSSSTL